MHQPVPVDPRGRIWLSNPSPTSSWATRGCRSSSSPARSPGSKSRAARLRLIVLKPSDETQRHPVVDRIKAEPVYLQDFTSLSDRSFVRWLRDNLPASFGAIRRVARRHPLRLARTAGWAAAQAWRDRRGWRPRAVYLKEWMRAVGSRRRAVAWRAGHAHPCPLRPPHHHCCVVGSAPRRPAVLVHRPRQGHLPDQLRTPKVCWVARCAPPTFVVTCTDANRQHLKRSPRGARARDVPRPERRLRAPACRWPPPAEAPDRLRIISVGRLVDKKGFDVLVDAVALLVERGVDVDCSIAGEPGDREADIRRRRHGGRPRRPVRVPRDAEPGRALRRVPPIQRLRPRLPHHRRRRPRRHPQRVDGGDGRRAPGGIDRGLRHSRAGRERRQRPAGSARGRRGPRGRDLATGQGPGTARIGWLRRAPEPSPSTSTARHWRARCRDSFARSS